MSESLCAKHGACRDSFCQRCQDIIENEQLRADLESKHNALKMASRNLDALSADLERVTAELGETKAALELLKQDYAGAAADRANLEKLLHEKGILDRDAVGVVPGRAAAGAAQLREELEEMRKRFALLALDTMTAPALDWFINGGGTTRDEKVDELIKRYCAVPRRQCADCGQRAPMKQVAGATMNDPDKLVCAWGCPS